MGFLNDIGGGLIGPALGLALEKHNDKRQINQQQKLQDMQQQGQMEMGNFNYQKQLDMWKATSYPGQIEQMKKAGINPGLVYGMGGGGGATTGQASGGVSGASAQGQSGELLAGTGMAMQMRAQNELLKAQKENIEADTVNKKAGAGKTVAETANVPLAGENIKADTANREQNTAVQKAEEELKKLEESYQKQTLTDRVGKLGYETAKAGNESEIKANELTISGQTVTEEIDRIKAEAVGAALKNKMTTTQTAAITEGVAQGWKEIEIKKYLAEQGMENKDQDQILGIVGQIIGIIGQLAGKKFGTMLEKRTRVITNDSRGHSQTKTTTKY